MKKIGVIGVKEGWSSEKLADAVQEKTGFRLLVDMDEVCFDMVEGKVYYKDFDLSTLDALIIKKIAPNYAPELLDRLEILRYLNETGLKVFSKPLNIIRILDRLSCTITLREANIPIPPTVITESVERATEAVFKFGKAVLKPLYTSKARGMKVVEAGRETKETIKQFKAYGNPVMYIQKMVQHPGKDLGMVFLGGEYIATYSRIGNKDSWNTTTHSGGKYGSYEASKELIELARRAQAIFNMDFTSVDIVETPEGPMIFEVSAFGGFKGLQEACGIDAAALYVDYVLKALKNG